MVPVPTGGERGVDEEDLVGGRVGADGHGTDMLEGSMVSSGDQGGRSLVSCMTRFSTLPRSRSASRGVLPPRWRRTRVSVGKVEATETKVRLLFWDMGKWVWKSWVIWMWWEDNLDLKWSWPERYMLTSPHARARARVHRRLAFALSRSCAHDAQPLIGTGVSE
jgi:hypothetical protein